MAIGDRRCPEQYPKEARVFINEPLPAFPEAVAVGDLDSDAKGSGARKNVGKARLDLIPVSAWRSIWHHPLKLKENYHLGLMLERLQAWQEGDTDRLREHLTDAMAERESSETVKVLEFGMAKYKAWNWAKGMPWSVCVGCILRHTAKIISGEEFDPESGISHWGHIHCNIIFLVYYADHYLEGDDRPPRYIK